MLKGIKKIRTKILLPTLMIIFIALVTTGSLSAYLTYSSTIKTLNQTMLETIEVASARISAELNVFKALLVELAGVVADIDPKEVLNVVDKAKARHGFKIMDITTPDGIVGSTGDDISSQDFFTVPRDQKIPYVSEPVMNSDQKSMTIYISVPIIIDGRFDGIMYMGFDAEQLNQIVASISVGDTGTAAIIDKEGTTIAYNDSSIVLMGYNTNDEQKSDSKLSRLAALERDVMAGNTGFGAYSYGGKDKFMTYAPIKDTNGWGMYITVIQSEFMNGTYASIIVSIVVIIAFLILAALILIALSRSISRPIMEVEQAALQMAKGNYDIDITYQSSDEAGSLADSMRQMIVTTKGIILDTIRGLGEVSNGNFDIIPKAEYIGVFKGIESAMVKIISGLSDIMAQVKMSTDQVASGSDQVASASQSLAQGATEQASSIQELSASISEVNEQIKNNARSSATANELATVAGAGLVASNEQMQEMIKAMEEISNSSAEISKIIKTIEDIAFQTNILALNAAVEAARAGVAGKGFAVVADEVRNLATKSSEAAKQTNVLIDGSVKSVEHGVKIASETAHSLESVVEGAREMTKLIIEISQASSEQSASISQINLGIEQISAVVQTNSATSEQSAAASEELNSQAKIMQDVVGRFKLMASGAPAIARVPKNNDCESKHNFGHENGSTKY